MGRRLRLALLVEESPEFGPETRSEKKIQNSEIQKFKKKKSEKKNSESITHKNLLRACRSDVVLEEMT